MQITEEQYAKEKESAQLLYKKLAPVKCNAISGELVHFTSEGYNHLIYKGSKERTKGDQIMRFRCLDLARKVLSLTTTIQEKEEGHVEVEIKMKKRRERVTKIVRFWAFISIMHNKKTKVIIKKTGEGKVIFWSIIPFWSTTKHGDGAYRFFSTGNLEED